MSSVKAGEMVQTHLDILFCVYTDEVNIMGEAQIEICNECGESVAAGSRRYCNRVPDLNSVETRREMHKQYPDGDFLCGECDERIKSSLSPLGDVLCEECVEHIKSSDYVELPSLTMDELDIVMFGLGSIACGDASFCEDTSTGDYENCTKCSHLRDKLNRVRE